MSKPLYYVLREGLVRGQGRYWRGRERSSGAPTLHEKQRKATNKWGPISLSVLAKRFTRRGYPMRVVAIVGRK